MAPNSPLSQINHAVFVFITVIILSHFDSFQALTFFFLFHFAQVHELRAFFDAHAQVIPDSIAEEAKDNNDDDEKEDDVGLAADNEKEAGPLSGVLKAGGALKVHASRRHGFLPSCVFYFLACLLCIDYFLTLFSG